MLSRSHRFHGYGSLRYVYREGRQFRGPNLLMRVHLNPRRKTYRCAVVISKKTEKSAVKRNKLRRKIYEIIRSFGPEISSPYDIVVTILKPELFTVAHSELTNQIKQLLTQAKIITK